MAVLSERAGFGKRNRGGEREAEREKERKVCARRDSAEEEDGYLCNIPFVLSSEHPLMYTTLATVTKTLSLPDGETERERERGEATATDCASQPPLRLLLYNLLHLRRIPASSARAPPLDISYEYRVQTVFSSPPEILLSTGPEIENIVHRRFFDTRRRSSADSSTLEGRLDPSAAPSLRKPIEKGFHRSRPWNDARTKVSPPDRDQSEPLRG